MMQRMRIALQLCDPCQSYILCQCLFFIEKHSHAGEQEDNTPDWVHVAVKREAQLTHLQSVRCCAS